MMDAMMDEISVLIDLNEMGNLTEKSHDSIDQLVMKNLGLQV
jgi:hypothetical protein